MRTVPPSERTYSVRQELVARYASFATSAYESDNQEQYRAVLDIAERTLTTIEKDVFVNVMMARIQRHKAHK